MKLKTQRQWTTRDGRRRYIRLFKCWKNMLARCAGVNVAGNGSRPWTGLAIEWRTWEEFREWSLRNGYSKARYSLDRLRGDEGYGPTNCEWVTRIENTKRQRERARYLRRIATGGGLKHEPKRLTVAGGM